MTMPVAVAVIAPCLMLQDFEPKLPECEWAINEDELVTHGRVLPRVRVVTAAVEVQATMSLQNFHPTP